MKSILLLFLFVALIHCKTLASRDLKKCYRKALMTLYWIPKEGDSDMSNNGKILSLSGDKSKTLKTTKGKTIAKVAKSTYRKFRMEGTGLLENGVMVNLDDGNDTFETVDREKAPFGLGSKNDNELVPWISVASNDIKLGTKLYIQKLDGLELPDGQKHNGCVRVDDRSWSFGSCQLDFFALQFEAYQKLEKILPNRINVVDQDCEILDYVTDSVKEWAVLD